MNGHTTNTRRHETQANICETLRPSGLWQQRNARGLLSKRSGRANSDRNEKLLVKIANYSTEKHPNVKSAYEAENETIETNT